MIFPSIDMAEKKVIIFVKSHQHYEGAEPEDLELISEGMMDTAEDGTVTLTYDETELTGLEGTRTSFTIRDDTVTLSRTGQVNSQMVFQKGRQHSSLYETPWGTMTVDIATSQLANRLSDRGGILDIHYSIAVEHRVAGRNQFKIRVREIGRQTI